MKIFYLININYKCLISYIYGNINNYDLNYRGVSALPKLKNNDLFVINSKKELDSLLKVIIEEKNDISTTSKKISAEVANSQFVYPLDTRLRGIRNE